MGALHNPPFARSPGAKTGLGASFPIRRTNSTGARCIKHQQTRVSEQPSHVHEQHVYDPRSPAHDS